MKRIVLAITLYISCMVVDYLVHYLNNRKSHQAQQPLKTLKAML